MAVVTVGSYDYVTGYIGDVEPSYMERSIAGHFGDRWFFGVDATLGVAVDATAALWQSPPLSRHDDVHRWCLDAVYQRLFRHSLKSAGTFDQALMIVLPETWLEQPRVLRQMAALLLESERKFPAVHFARPSVCCCVGCGKASALVVDCGHHSSTAAAVADGYVLRRSIHHAEGLGGQAITEYVKKHLTQEQLASLGVHSPYARISAITEKIALDAELNTLKLQLLRGKPLVAPDGQSLSVTLEDPLAPLFAPHQWSAEPSQQPKSLPELLAACRERVDVELLPRLPILCSGGTSLAPGFDQRLLREAMPLDGGLRFIPPLVPCGAYAMWAGASMIASTESFQSLWITPQEWDEVGCSIFERKLLN